MKEDDNNWLEPDRAGSKELEIVMGTSTSHSPLPRLGRWSMCRAVRIPKGFRSSIIWFRFVLFDALMFELD